MYYYEGATNLCANANNFILLAWSFKIVVAIRYRPFGLRRRPYIHAFANFTSNAALFATVLRYRIDKFFSLESIL